MTPDAERVMLDDPKRMRQRDGLPPDEVTRRIELNQRHVLHQTIDSLKSTINTVDLLLINRFGITLQELLDGAPEDDRRTLESKRTLVQWRAEHVQRLRQFGCCGVCGYCRHEAGTLYQRAYDAGGSASS